MKLGNFEEPEHSRGLLESYASEAIRLSQSILIIDDDTEVADTCARVLKTANFTCLVAYDTPMALLLFDSSQPALVLSDINLPTGDGYEIARYVKQKSPGTPVVLMTTYHRADASHQASGAGATGFLRKPFANAELISIVKSLLGIG